MYAPSDADYKFHLAVHVTSLICMCRQQQCCAAGAGLLGLVFFIAIEVHPHAAIIVHLGAVAGAGQDTVAIRRHERGIVRSGHEVTNDFSIRPASIVVASTMPGAAITITVAGRIDCKYFQQARVITENLCAVRAEITGDIVEMVEAEWDYYIEEKGRELAALGASGAYEHKTSPIVYYNGSNYIGGLDDYLEWVATRYEYEDQTAPSLYERFAKKEYDNYLASLGHQFVFFDVAVGNTPARRVTFELYSDVAPKTCENFRALCTGEKGTADKVKLHYKNNLFHRVVKNGWVQAGDIVSSDCAGDGSTSIYGGTFPDESFAVKQNGPGILSMANCGAHTNGSQFFVSLRSLDWLDTQVVAFGRVISGMDVMRELGSVETENQRPVGDCKITGCGEIKPGKKEIPQAPQLFGGLDLRRRKTKRKNLDLRRRKTKISKLKKIFTEIDKNGDGELSKDELVQNLKDPSSSLREEFPNHANEIPNIFEELDRDGSGMIDWDEFREGALSALSAPGGRGH